MGDITTAPAETRTVSAQHLFTHPPQDAPQGWVPSNEVADKTGSMEVLVGLKRANHTLQMAEPALMSRSLVRSSLLKMVAGSWRLEAHLPQHHLGELSSLCSTRNA